MPPESQLDKKYRHTHLTRIASLVTVRDIYTPFVASFDGHRTVADVWENWSIDLCGDDSPLNQMALVLRDGKAVGLLSFCALEADKKDVFECMDEIRLDGLVTEDTSLAHAAEMFTSCHAYFFVVINGNDFVGWLSYHDLYKLPFRLCLFASILAIEEKMTQVAQRYAARAIETLTDGRQAAARRIYQLRGFPRDQNGNEAPAPLVTCTSFCDKATMLQGCAETKYRIPEAGQKKWMALAEKVRNAIAHPNPDEHFSPLVKRELFGGLLGWMRRLDAELTAFLEIGSAISD